MLWVVWLVWPDQPEVKAYCFNVNKLCPPHIFGLSLPKTITAPKTKKKIVCLSTDDFLELDQSVGGGGRTLLMSIANLTDMYSTTFLTFLNTNHSLIFIAKLHLCTLQNQSRHCSNTIILNLESQINFESKIFFHIFRMSKCERRKKKKKKKKKKNTFFRNPQIRVGIQTHLDSSD